MPGERIQMDVTKLRPKAYQFTAIDDCTRLKVIRVYPNKRADSAVDFLGEVLDSFPFPIQRVQPDWGTEFFNFKFQEELHEHFIKYRPVKPKSHWQKYNEAEKSVPIQPEVTDLFRESNEQVYARNEEYWALIKKKITLSKQDDYMNVIFK